ncbi:5-formyltetrahydrofolate cyclo-ligase [Winogradskyella maritima]|uniref:5-formyltetrahydrofolate cyclo-ligase n=1 Tax=Winogradskyella maritima TaxID=1517766 RepID=A0ABV8AEY1_9FLAO|nr:5-formyltetrahydrofolate cyclo-ligase [Winogradskyella maritima]
MTKPELRQKYKALRQSLSADAIEEKSLAIANRLLTLDIWSHDFYHVFLTIETQKEVNTDYLLNILAGKDKNIVISKSNFEDFSLSHYLLTDNAKLELNAYNIPEPVNGIPIEAQQLNVVFVPLLAFDKSGNRVGYGKGFYDRFLANCKPETLKIGLSFFEAEDQLIEASEDDVGLDFCMTPESVYVFKKSD